MADLGWMYDVVVDANRERSLETLIRRMGKLGEEYGEAWEAFLNVTSAQNGKDKNWEDVREEFIDIAIVALDILATRLPIDDGKTDEELNDEIIAITKTKLKKWEHAKTCRTDAVSEDS